MGAFTDTWNWQDVLVCPLPTCHGTLSTQHRGQLTCSQCGESYGIAGPVPDLTANIWRQQARANTWERLQENGLASYHAAPNQNLGVGERPDCFAFSRFCQLQGKVLDVGCGPQPWPAYFAEHAVGTQFFGVDPLADAAGAYPKFRALGEYLPFRDRVFDRVLFATSLDHMMDPVATLREARRVCKPDGSVLLWSGEKKPGAPKPKESPEWYRRLQIPEGAEDPFHFRRFTEDEVQAMCVQAGLTILDHETIRVDDWRANHFYRLK